MVLTKLNLIYPNNWMLSQSECSKEDSVFNWFLCSKRIQDPETGKYYAEISSSSLFVDPESGKMYSIPDTPKLLIVNSTDNLSGDTLKNSKFSGFAVVNSCSGNCKSKCRKCQMGHSKESHKLNYPVCHENYFLVENTKIKVLDQSKCALVNYSKKNNDALISVYPNFLTTKEIDSLLEYNSCNIINKILLDILNHNL